MLKYKSSGNYKNEEARGREKENKIIINERKRCIIKQNINQKDRKQNKKNNKSFHQEIKCVCSIMFNSQK